MCYGKFVTYAKQHACSVLFFSRPRYKAWAHNGRTFSINLCPLSYWLTLPRGVLSLFTPWSCPRLDVVHPDRAWFSSPACTVQLFPALSCNSFVSFVLLDLSAPFLLQLCEEPTHLFLCCPRNPQNFSQSFHLKGAFLHSFSESSFHTAPCGLGGVVE